MKGNKINQYEENLDNLTSDDLINIIENFKVTEYEKKRDNYSNVFYLMNLRENTHSELLTWLFNYQENDKFSIRREFAEKFLELVGVKEEIKTVKTQVKSKNGIPDIIIETNNTVVIVEVKLDAKTSVTIDESGKRRTQYERYQNYYEKEYSKNKEYILIYTTEERLKNEKNFFLKEKLIKEMAGIDIVDELGYKRLEFSDIVLILFFVLKQEIQNKKSFKEQNDITINFIKNFIGMVKNENNISIIENVLNKIEKLNKIENSTYKITKKELGDWGYRRPLRCNVHLNEFLNKLTEKDVKNLLIQYIEYWLYCNPIIDSYTEVIEYNGEFFNIYSICEKLNEKKIEESIQIEEKLNTKLQKIKEIDNKRTYIAKFKK